jgi:hypothetical protein
MVTLLRLYPSRKYPSRKDVSFAQSNFLTPSQRPHKHPSLAPFRLRSIRSPSGPSTLASSTSSRKSPLSHPKPFKKNFYLSHISVKCALLVHYFSLISLVFLNTYKYLNCPNICIYIYIIPFKPPRRRV